MKKIYERFSRVSYYPDPGFSENWDYEFPMNRFRHSSSASLEKKCTLMSLILLLRILSVNRFLINHRHIVQTDRKSEVPIKYPLNVKEVLFIWVQWVYFENWTRLAKVDIQKTNDLAAGELAIMTLPKAKILSLFR